MDKKVILWMVPVLTTVHNIEEVLFMPFVIERRNSSIPAFLGGLLPPVTYAQFVLAVSVATAVPYLIASFSNTGRQGGAGVTLLVSIQAMMLVNVFAHLSFAVMMGGYAPGVVTAVAVELPFSISMLRRAVRERWVSGRAMVLLIAIGLPLNVIALPALPILSGEIVRLLTRVG